MYKLSLHRCTMYMQEQGYDRIRKITILQTTSVVISLGQDHEELLKILLGKNCWGTGQSYGFIIAPHGWRDLGATVLTK